MPSTGIHKHKTFDAVIFSGFLLGFFSLRKSFKFPTQEEGIYKSVPG